MYDFSIEEINKMIDEFKDRESFWIQLEFDFNQKTDDIHNKENDCPQTCISCNEIYPYAKSNLADGKFKCYYCRNYGT